MTNDVAVRLGTEEVPAPERCLSDGNAEEAFRLAKPLAEGVRHAQFTG